MKILLIAGHGQGDPGACANGYQEATLTREIVDLLAIKLNNYADVTVFDTNKNMSKFLKSNLYNFKNFDYVFEVHFNAGVGDTKGNFQTTGTEILVHTKECGTSVEELVLKKISLLGFKNRGVKKRSNLLNMNICKGNQGVSYALLETCFIDDLDDMSLYFKKKDNVIKAVADGIINGFNLRTKEEDQKVARTVMQLPNEVYVQEISPSDFKIEIYDKTKKNIPKSNYFNCGYFTYEGKGNSIPIGNLANDSKVISQSKDHADWINVSKKKLTTIYTTNDGQCGILKTNNLSEIKNLKTAVSGIPIIVNAKYVPIEDIKAEGYFGNELYDTWHGFLGIRHNKLVYVAMKCDYSKMCWALVALGIYNAIKLDGGGSFILKNGEIIKTTDENRRIHNIATWSK